jgi:hypothetical protein
MRDVSLGRRIILRREPFRLNKWIAGELLEADREKVGIRQMAGKTRLVEKQG